jgi:F-type H+-transporting ATPase subunit gamma
MASLKEIRQRIRSAKNIRQITRAMKLVAAARLTRAKNRVEEARPYSGKLREFMASVGSAGSLPDHPLLEAREVHRHALVLITADRGLCGAYNTNLIKKASDWLKAPTDFEKALATVGKKGRLFFSKRGYDSIYSLTLPTSGAALEHAEELTAELVRMFTSGEVDAVSLCYSRFFSAIRQEPQIVQLLPIEPPAAESTSGEKEYDYEPDPEELLGLLLPKYVLTLVLQTLLESSASEFGARMTAMTSATDSATDMINSLTLSANRARQTKITTEILEIVGGAEALNG